MAENRLCKRKDKHQRKTVVLSGVSNSIPIESWDEFEARLPWKKNIDRNLLFTKTKLLRSPKAEHDCHGEEFLFGDEEDCYLNIVGDHLGQNTINTNMLTLITPNKLTNELLN